MQIFVGFLKDIINIMLKKIKKITLDDVAKAAGASVGAVSKALNDKNGVGLTRRNHILQVASELGYQKSKVSSSSDNALKSIRLITYDQHASGDPFYNEIIRGIFEESTKLNLSIELQLLPNDIDDVDPAITTLMKHRCDSQGLILVGVESPHLLQAIARLECPVTIVNGMDRLMRINSISPDYELGGWLATRHLIEQGHTEIVHVTHPYRQSLKQRILGFRNALEESGLEFSYAKNIIDTHSSSQSSNDSYHAIIKRIENNTLTCTGFVCASDMVALGVLKALTEYGYSVPNDFSMIGFDDLPVSSLCTPTLSTIRIDRERLGRDAVNLLLIKTHRHASVVRMLSSVNLIQRESVARIN